MRLVFIEGDELATRNGVACFVHQGLRPRYILVVFSCALGDALVDELARGVLNRSEIAGRDMGSQPSLLFGRECDRHGFS